MVLPSGERAGKRIHNGLVSALTTIVAVRAIKERKNFFMLSNIFRYVVMGSK